MARDDFEIVNEKPIGCGQFGTVFRARRRSDGRMTALKLILRHGQNDADAIAAERRGAILQQKFASLHGMVPEVFEFGPDGDDFYIAMELVEGPSLEERLRDGALPCEEAVAHARWLCRFLDKAHAFSPMVEGRPYRLLHNDLKPAHLKIPDTCERKVLDFGIATALEETRELATDVGRTIAYAAPERLLSERVNVHADFWSLGVMLYEMASGHRPYPALEGPRHRRQLYSAITNNAPREPLPRNCAPHLQGIINRLLAFQPEHRYQSATEIDADLERFSRGATPEAAAYFETPATMPVTRSAGAAVAEVAAVPLTVAPPIPSVPPTDPLPPPVSRLVATPSSDSTSSLPASILPRRSLAVRLVPAAAVLAFLVLVATEGVAWLFAEHFRDTIPAIDERTVISSHEAYDAVARWSLLDLGLRMRVNQPLAAALRVVGDRVIADYRREAPTAGTEEWRQAQAAFSWARTLSPRDNSLRSKQLVADGHLSRLAAQKARPPASATSMAQTAVARFRDAAAADPSSFDPYVGMAVTEVYALGDVDGALAALNEAVKRGYTATRRETALIGDAYMRRGFTGRRRAALLTGDERHTALVNARSDYERCVSSFAQILDFGKSAKNLEACKAQIRRIDQQLDAAGF
jgi:eukaryotic-like serine/threonine-protein kinase